MKRWDALAAIADAFPRDPLVVTLGGSTRELAALRRSANHLYVLDSMGLPPAIGLGLALGLDDAKFERVVVIEGDGSLLMGLSTLATIGLVRPEKLALLILDNGAYSATGNQPTAASAVDFCAMARACGFQTQEVRDLDGLKQSLEWVRSTSGPLLVRAYTEIDAAKVPYLLEDPVLVGATFADYVVRNK